MKIAPFFITLFFTLMLIIPSASATRSDSIDSGKTVVTLMSSHVTVAPGQNFHFALEAQLDPHWHTYWKNPGDSGEAVTLEWDLPDLLSVGDIVWPMPETIATGPIINYAFEGAPVFVVPVTLSSRAAPGTLIPVNVDAYYLVCKDICIPESATLSFDVMVGTPEVHPLSSAQINRALEQTPKAGPVTGILDYDAGQVSMTLSGLPDDIDDGTLYFYPNAQGIIDHSAQQVTVNSVSAAAISAKTLTTTAGFAWDNGHPKSVSGVLGYAKDGVVTGQTLDMPVGTVVRAAPTAASTNSAQAAPAGNASGTSSVVSETVVPEGMTWISALIGAFLGGLILNLMPCVFPVVSLKALTIAKLAHGERKAIRREAWAYTLGVVVMFVALVAILLQFKEGWGFQLQSPPVVGTLALLLFVVGLNLLGMFEIGGRFQSAGAGLTTQSGSKGSFFTGLLAVIVATPCTAPFMAAAVGYALTQTAFISVSVFLALAVGFAAPFLLLAYIPGLARVLPKPGPWMVRFKELLAFPMLAAAIWLVWVVTIQSGEFGLVRLLGAMLLAGFAIWLLRQPGTFRKILCAVSVISALVLVGTLHSKPVEYVGVDQWSPERVTEIRASGQPVFIDFTAAWCVTCQANKKAVLDTEPVRALFTEYNTAFLVADWTNKNDAIADELARHGRAGVPLYLLYPPGNDDVNPVILPQILTKTVIQQALEGIEN